MSTLTPRGVVAAFELGRFYQRGVEIATDTRRSPETRERKVLREGMDVLAAGGAHEAATLLSGFANGAAS